MTNVENINKIKYTFLLSSRSILYVSQKPEVSQLCVLLFRKMYKDMQQRNSRDRKAVCIRPKERK